VSPEGGFSISAAQIMSIAIIVLLTYSNTRGVNVGIVIQNLFTSAKFISSQSNK
jgi:APA family basic amino acid/polyamine antiporter